MTYQELKKHIGHKIVCANYGIEGQDPENIAIECETCSQVLFDELKNEDPDPFKYSDFETIVKA